MIRIGHIDFINMIPLDLHHARELSYVRIPGPPTMINRMLLKGDVDVGVISTAYFLQHTEELLRLGRFGIISDGPVLSVVLFSKRDLSDNVDRRILKVYETPQSATSVLLNRLIIPKSYHLEVQPVTSRLEAEAVLLIGNEALLEREKKEWAHQYDLGEEWKKLTGLPMVFAVLATSKENFNLKKEELIRYLKILEENYYEAIKDKAVWVAKAKTMVPLKEEYLNRYFQGLKYEIDAREEQAIALFEKMIKQSSFPRPHEG